jgi:hypothetical protein
MSATEQGKLVIGDMIFNGYVFPETTLSDNLLGLADLCNKKSMVVQNLVF